MARERKKAGGEYLEDEDFSSQSWDQSDRQQRQQLDAKRRILNDQSLIVPADLTPEALKQADLQLTQEDWTHAENWHFKAQPDMKLKMLCIIFFRSMDAHNSFNIKFWQTRLSLLFFRLFESTPAGDAYVNAAVEAKHSPNIFTARENFVGMWSSGQASLPKWNKTADKKYKEMVRELHRLFDYYKLNPQAAAAGALALMEGSQAEVEMDALVEDFALVAQRVLREFSVGDMERKMQIIQLVEGEKESKGMEGAFGLSS